MARCSLNLSFPGRLLALYRGRYLKEIGVGDVSFRANPIEMPWTEAIKRQEKDETY